MLLLGGKKEKKRQLYKYYFMYIILSGVDKCGKSTLARELSKFLYFPVINRLVPKENIFIECIDTLTHYDEPMIIDRFYLDEEAYGPIMRNKSRFDFRELKLIEMMMMSLNSFNIYTQDTLDKVKERFKTDNETSTHSFEIEPLQDMFEIAIKNSSLNWHRYKIGDSISSLACMIEKQFSSVDIKEIIKFRNYRTVGNLNSEVIFVGEKYGSKLLLPLIPFGNNSPGLVLFKALNKAGVDFKNIILTNAFKHGLTDIENKNALIDEMSLPFVKKVICLGNSAYEYVKSVESSYNKLTGESLKIYKIKHPSYVASYSNMSIENYAAEIKYAYLQI